VQPVHGAAETTADMLKGASVELHLGGPVNGLHEAHYA